MERGESSMAITIRFQSLMEDLLADKETEGLVAVTLDV
jgi:hypothetical protein